MSPRNGAQIWTAPLLLNAASGVGLVAALLAEGPIDDVSALALSAPVLAVCWCALPSTQRRRSSDAAREP